MKTTIESLNSARQVAKEGRTFVEDANATIVRNDNGFHVTKHDYRMEAKSFKTFRAALHYMYN